MNAELTVEFGEPNVGITFEGQNLDASTGIPVARGYGVTSVNGKTGNVILDASDIGVPSIINSMYGGPTLYTMIPFTFGNTTFWDYDGSIQTWVGIMSLDNVYIHDAVSPVELFPEMPLTDTVLSAWATNYPDVSKVKLLAQLTQRGDSIIISVQFETTNGSASPSDYGMTISGYVLVGGV